MNRSGTFKKHFWLSEKVSVQKEQDSVGSRAASGPLWPYTEESCCVTSPPPGTSVGRAGPS